jgi:hypothetical protein
MVRYADDSTTAHHRDEEERQREVTRPLPGHASRFRATHSPHDCRPTLRQSSSGSAV